MIIVGLPYLVTEILDLEAAQANRLYGFAEGALAVGGLTGGICAGIFSKKLAIEKSATMLIACAVYVFPMGITLMLFFSGFISFPVRFP